jgi:hypothetical protein
VAGSTIQVRGLRELRGALRDIEKTLGPELRKGLNEVADVVLDTARPLVPTRSGDARSSLKAGSTEKAVQIKAGGTKAPYWGFLDFGGKVGRKKSVKRRFIQEGRYIYPTLRNRAGAIEDKFYEVIDRVTEGLR